MAIEKLAGAAQVGAATQSPPTKERFADVASKISGPAREPGAGVRTGPAAPAEATSSKAQMGVHCAEGIGSQKAVASAQPVNRTEAARVAERVLEAQHKLDQILELAQSGKTFSAAELIALQAHVYGASQELDLAGKVVEKATTGLKTLLQTQL